MRAVREHEEGSLPSNAYHRPVMTPEVLEYLAPRRGGVYLDGTLGGGGHAEAILAASPEARLLGVDRDPEALAEAGRRLAPFAERATLMRGDYANAPELFDLVREGTLAGVLLDLGVSSRQIDIRERGFSFRPGTPLDMRMAVSEESGPTAAELLNRLTREELTDLFRRYGEERRAAVLASQIVRRRQEEPLRLSDDLVAAMEAVWRRPVSPSDRARIFQALRIAVNRELASLEHALPQLRDALAEGGRLVVISYHSLEDRLVKRAFRDWSRACVCPPDLPVCRCRGRPLGRTLTKGPVRPGEDEVTENPRSRSARLRAWERGS